MNGDGRGEHSSEPAEGSQEQGEEAEEQVRREQDDAADPGAGAPEPAPGFGVSDEGPGQAG